MRRFDMRDSTYAHCQGDAPGSYTLGVRVALCSQCTRVCICAPQHLLTHHLVTLSEGRAVCVCLMSTKHATATRCLPLNYESLGAMIPLLLAASTRINYSLCIVPQLHYSSFTRALTFALLRPLYSCQRRSCNCCTV